MGGLPYELNFSPSETGYKSPGAPQAAAQKTRSASELAENLWWNRTSDQVAPTWNTAELPTWVENQAEQKVMKYNGQITEWMLLPAAFQSSNGNIGMLEKMDLWAYNDVFAMAQSYLLKYNLDEKKTTDLVRAINQVIAEQLGATQDEQGRKALFQDHLQEQWSATAATDDAPIGEAAPTIIDQEAIRTKKLEVCLEKSVIAYKFLHDMYGVNCTLCFDRDYQGEAHAYVELPGGWHFHPNSPGKDDETGFFKPNFKSA